jgi:hypothetical protein
MRRTLVWRFEGEQEATVSVSRFVEGGLTKAVYGNYILLTELRGAMTF